MSLTDSLKSKNWRIVERWITILGLLEDKNKNFYPKNLGRELYEFGFLGDSDNFEEREPILTDKTLQRDIEDIEKIFNIKSTKIGRREYRFNELRNNSTLYKEILKYYFTEALGQNNTEIIVEKLMEIWSSPLKNLVYIKLAIQNCYPLVITYQRSKNEIIKKREIEPLKTLFDDNQVRLIANEIKSLSGRQLMNFNFFNMQNVEIQSKRIFQTTKINLLEEYKNSLYFIRNPEQRKTYKIIFSSNYEKEINSFLAKKEYKIINHQDKLLVTLTVDSIEEVIKWVWNFREDAEILEPLEARQLYRDKLKKLIKVYSE